MVQELNLGDGLEVEALQAGLQALTQHPDVRAVIAFGSRARGDAQADSDLDLAVIHRQPQLTPQEKLKAWRSYRKLLGSVPVGVDLLVSGWEDAAHLAGSRWHVMGDIAREGKVLYVAR
jgi:predicted nucleotidyltransferase